jgi:hypothetical protein
MHKRRIADMLANVLTLITGVKSVRGVHPLSSKMGTGGLSQV